MHPRYIARGHRASPLRSSRLCSPVCDITYSHAYSRVSTYEHDTHRARPPGVSNEALLPRAGGRRPGCPTLLDGQTFRDGSARGLGLSRQDLTLDVPSARELGLSRQDLTLDAARRVGERTGTVTSRSDPRRRCLTVRRLRDAVARRLGLSRQDLPPLTSCVLGGL